MGERRHFGTDGIRGRVGEGAISADFVLKLGWAAGRALSRDGRRPVVVIGKDTRISGYMFESALQAGQWRPAPTCGCSGRCRRRRGLPHPLAARRRRHRHQRLAQPAPRQRDQVLFRARREARRRHRACDRGGAGRRFPPCPPKPSARRCISDAATRYHAEFCKIHGAAGFHHGRLASGAGLRARGQLRVGPRVFTELGARVDAIGIAPDGLNINRGVGSTHPGPRRAVRERCHARYRVRWRRRPGDLHRQRRARGGRRRADPRPRPAARPAAGAGRWPAR